MAELPDAIRRLGSLLGAARIAHEVISDSYRDLAAEGSPTEEQLELRDESIRITLVELPDITVEARRLAKLWQEQSVLDPEAARATHSQLAAELVRIEPKIRDSHERQRQIAARLRSML